MKTWDDTDLGPDETRTAAEALLLTDQVIDEDAKIPVRGRRRAWRVNHIARIAGPRPIQISTDGLGTWHYKIGEPIIIRTRG